MIPKEIYFYWGNKTLSFLRYITLYSFCKFNPDWKVNLILKDNEKEWKRWASGEQDDNTYTGKDYLPEVEKLDINIKGFDYNFIINIDPCMMNPHIKDLLWWYILATQGGFVTDMDIVFFGSFSLIYEKLKLDNADIALTCFSGLPLEKYIPVTLMGGSPNNSFFKDILERAKRNYDPHSYECCGTKCIGFDNLTRIQEAYKFLKVVQLPDTIIYPFITKYEPADFVDALCKLDKSEELLEDTIGIHWYGGGLAEQLVKTLNEGTYRNANFTLAKLIQRVMK